MTSPAPTPAAPVTSDQRSGPIRVATATTGAGHLRAGTGNQDAIHVHVEDTGAVIVALADGAGSARHAAEGAWHAAQAATEALSLHAHAPASAFKQLLDQRLTSAGQPAGHYNATIMAARIEPGGQVILLHCGDSLALHRQADGTFTVSAEPTEGEFAGETIFPATSPADAVQVTYLHTTALLLSSDGLAPLLLSRRAPHQPTLAVLADWMLHPDDLTPSMQDLLRHAQDTGRADDDLTLALIHVA